MTPPDRYVWRRPTLAQLREAAPGTLLARVLGPDGRIAAEGLLVSYNPEREAAALFGAGPFPGGSVWQVSAAPGQIWLRYRR